METDYEKQQEEARQASSKARAELRQKASDWIKEHWKADAPCPMCGHTDWYVYEPLALDPLGVPPFPGAVFGVAPVVCTTCGYGVYLSLITVGLVEAGGPAKAEEPEQKPEAGSDES